MGTMAFVGALGDDDNGIDSGSAYVYGPTAPAITSTAVTIGFAGAQYSYQLSTTGFPGPSFSLPTAPSGMTFSDSINGLLTWIPVSVGQFDVTAVASNSAGIDDQSFYHHNY